MRARHQNGAIRGRTGLLWRVLLNEEGPGMGACSPTGDIKEPTKTLTPEQAFLSIHEEELRCEVPGSRQDTVT